jgi:hypothetical protein
MLVRALVACLCLAAAGLATGASADGKKPGPAGDPHGRPGKHDQAATTGTAGTAVLAPEQPAAAPKKQSKADAKAAGKPGVGNARKSAGSGSSGSGSGSSGGSSSTSTSPPPAPASAATPHAAPQASRSHTSKKHRARTGGKRHGTRRPAARRRATVAARSGTAAGRAPVATGRVQPTARANRPKAAAPRHRHDQGGPASPVIRTFERVVRVVPAALKAAVVVLAFLLLVAAIAYFLLARTTRYLARQRKALLGEIGVLQAALLPDVPEEIGGLRPSVAYRPADGPAAGGDFYDAFPLEGGRVGIVIGDISGHGRDALMHTSLLRHTLRAYLDAGLEPRAALQVAGRVLDREADEIATVILATYEPGSQLLRYASAGHPPPVFLGPPDHAPVTAASSPPIGAGVRTGLRQTTVSIPDGSAICLFTDGLIEARRSGTMIGRLGLVRIIGELGRDMSAEALLDRVAAEVDRVTDDMAACLFRVEGRPDIDLVRIEEIEVSREDAGHPAIGAFLAACGVEPDEAERLAPFVRETVHRFGRAVVRVTISGEGLSSEVLPANVESLAAAGSRRGAA